MEQLAVGCKKILGVGVAVSDLCIKIGCWRRGVRGKEEVLLGLWSFVQRSFHMTLLKVPRLLSVEITHAMGCGFLLYGLGTSWGFSRRPYVRLR